MKAAPAEEAPQEEDSEPLLAVDFSVQNPFPDDTRRFYLEENEYQLFNRQGEPGAVALYEQKPFGEVQITSHLRRLSGTKDGGYGLVFLAEDSASFFCVLLSANQNYCISRLQQNQWSDLVDWIHNDNIYDEQNENELRVDLFPGMLRLWINGSLADVVRTEFPASGKVGLIAANSNLHIACRTFEVRQARKL